MDRRKFLGAAALLPAAAILPAEAAQPEVVCDFDTSTVLNSPSPSIWAKSPRFIAELRYKACSTRTIDQRVAAAIPEGFARKASLQMGGRVVREERLYRNGVLMEHNVVAIY